MSFLRRSPSWLEDRQWDRAFTRVLWRRCEDVVALVLQTLHLEKFHFLQTIHVWGWIKEGFQPGPFLACQAVLTAGLRTFRAQWGGGGEEKVSFLCFADNMFPWLVSICFLKGSPCNKALVS